MLQNKRELLKALKISLFNLLLFSSQITLAQDIHFTQFWDPNSFNNPSMIGSFDGTIRLCGMYRSQWSQFNTPLQTTFAEGNIKIPIKENYLAFGGSFLNDKLPFLGYNQNRVFGTLMYQMHLTRDITVGLGFQGGARITSMDYSKLTFDRQWDPNTGIFDPVNPSFERYDGNSVITPILNLGSNINLLKNNILHTFDIGVSNLNSPKDFYYKSNSSIPIKIAINYHNYIPIKETWTLMPKVGALYSGASNSILSGILVKKKLSNFQYLYGGFMMRWGLDRNGDAITPTIGYKVNAFKIGFSYDQNYSGLSTLGLKNAYELSIVYILSPPKNKYFSIDCMRL